LAGGPAPARAAAMPDRGARGVGQARRLGGREPAAPPLLRPLAASILMHIAIAMVMTLSVSLSTQVTPPAPRPGRIMEATAVDAAALRAREEAERAAREEQARREAEAKQRADEEARREAEAKQRAEEQARRAAEAKQRAEEEARREAEAKQRAEEQARRAAEAKRRAEEEARREAEAKQRAEEQARREAEAERLRREREAAARRQRELEEALAAEEAAMAAAARAERDEREIRRYIGRIARKVEGGFSYPPDLRRGLSCIIYVRMIPGGEVAEVRIVESSGSAVFDRQAELAVRKASPLPVPGERRLFDKMREIRFTFRPSG